MSQDDARPQAGRRSTRQPRARRVSRRAALGAALAAPLASPLLTGCGSAQASPRRLRIGHLSNLTHGVALAGIARGTFARHLSGTRIEREVFDNGPAVVRALLAGALDIAYLGPNPAITAWVRTKGRGVRLVAGGAQNGAALVARPDIASLDALRGHAVSTPQSGGTQDVALKTLLAAHGVPTGAGARDVETLWMGNAQTLDQFRQGRLAASYQAEPWVSRLVVEAGAHVLVDERDSWPSRHFATTSVLASQDVLERAPEQVERLLGAHVETVQWLREHREEAATLLDAEIAALRGAKLKPAVMTRAMANVEFSWDPMVENIEQVAEHTWRTGGIDPRPDLRGLADLAPLNRVLAARSLPAVAGASALAAHPTERG